MPLPKGPPSRLWYALASHLPSSSDYTLLPRSTYTDHCPEKHIHKTHYPLFYVPGAEHFLSANSQNHRSAVRAASLPVYVVHSHVPQYENCECNNFYLLPQSGHSVPPIDMAALFPGSSVLSRPKKHLLIVSFLHNTYAILLASEIY